MVDLNDIAKSLLGMDIAETERLTRDAIDAGIPATDILENSIVAAMGVIGDRFSKGEIFFPELLMSGEAARTALNLIRPELRSQAESGGVRGRAAIGTVQGDVHDIGKNIVIMMLETNGWEVTDLGVDVAPDDFCAAIRENDFQVLGLSALLTVTMPAQEQTIEAIKAAGLRDKVKIAIGGAVVDQRFADHIGADCYAVDAAEAVKKLNDLVR